MFIFHFKTYKTGEPKNFHHTWSEDVIFLGKPLKAIHLNKGYFNLITRDFRSYGGHLIP